MHSTILKKSVLVSAIAICAALYAIGAYATAYIPSPWGRGQFRPAIIIPVVFATIFGPFVGAVGGAIGTLIADSLKHFEIYLPSLVAAVPGHIVALYVYGLIIKKFSWRRFIAATHLSLLAGNFTTALLYVVFVFGKFLPGLILGLLIWWYITMLPFVILFVPLIIRAISAAFPTLVPEEVKSSSLKRELPSKEFVASLAIPGVLMLIMGVLIFISPEVMGFFLPGSFSKYRNIVGELLKTMFIVTGGANAAGALLFSKFFSK